MLRLERVVSAIPTHHHPQRLSKYKDYEHSLKVEGLTFPVQTKQIPLFEKLNPSISINVFAFEESSKGFTMEYRSPGRERKHHVNLLLLEDADNPSKRHYVWIKNMSAVVSHRTKQRCNIRLQFVSAPLCMSASARQAHTVLCSTRASTGCLSESPKRKGVCTKVPIEAQTTPPPFLPGVRFVLNRF